MCLYVFILFGIWFKKIKMNVKVSVVNLWKFFGLFGNILEFYDY